MKWNTIFIINSKVYYMSSQYQYGKFQIVIVFARTEAMHFKAILPAFYVYLFLIKINVFLNI